MVSKADPLESTRCRLILLLGNWREIGNRETLSALVMMIEAIQDLQSRADAVGWSREPPSEVGHYLKRLDGDDVTLHVFYADPSELGKDHSPAWWYGPIHRPPSTREGDGVELP